MNPFTARSGPSMVFRPVMRALALCCIGIVVTAGPAAPQTRNARSTLDTWRSTVVLYSQNEVALITMKYSWCAPGLLRIDYPGAENAGAYDILDTDTGRAIAVRPATRQYKETSRPAAEGEALREAHEFIGTLMFQTPPPKPSTDLGESEQGGNRIHRYEATHAGTRYEQWVDAATKAIVEVRMFQGSTQKLSQTFRDIEINPALSGDLFAITPPPGYTPQGGAAK